MRRPLVTLALLLAGQFPAGSTAGSDVDPGFCAWAQGVIAETALVPAVNVHRDWASFVDSKPTDQPFEIDQYYSSFLPGEGAPVTTVSCKMRTAERINAVHGSLDGTDTPRAGAESSCDEIHRRMLEQVYQAVPAAHVAIPRERWDVLEEDMKFTGSGWVDPWPFVSVTAGEGGRLRLHTRALYAPHAWWIPMPERFLGNYYCHLAAPGYIEALVRGQQTLTQ